MPTLPARPFYQDGDYTTPVLVWTSPRSYPRAGEGDMSTYLYRRRYLVRWEAYVPTQPGTPDPLDSTAYLLEEIPPEGGRTPISEFERIYCTLPDPAFRPGSLIYSLPSLPLASALTGDAVREPFFNGIARSRAGQDQPVQIYTSKACVDSGIVTAPTGGTFTLSAGGVATSALAWNASTTTIATALNGLAAISAWGSVTVTGAVNTTTGLAVAFPAFSPSFSINTSGLTTAWGNAVTSSFSSFPQGGAAGYAVNFTFGTDNATMTSKGVAISLNTSAVGNVATSSITDTQGTNNLGDGGLVGILRIRLKSAPGTLLGLGDFIVTLDGVSASLRRDSSLSNYSARIQTALGAKAKVLTARYTGQVPTSYTEIDVEVLYRPIVTGGNFTLGIFGQTTANIAWNASASAIASALNLLSNVSARGGTSVLDYSSEGVSRFSSTFVPPLIGINPASLTGPGSPYTAANQSTATSANGFRTQTITFAGAGGARSLTLASHGIRGGMSIAVKAGGSWTFVSTGYTVIDADRIEVDTTVAPFSSATTITNLGRLVLSHSARSIRLRSSAETRFYLTGPAPSAVTLEQIQPEALQLTPERFYSSLTNGDATVIYDESDVQQWRGPIYAKTLTNVSLAGLA